MGFSSQNQGDFNYDGTVDSLDFNLLASNFGQTYTGSGGGGGNFMSGGNEGGGDDGWQQLIDFANEHGITPPTR